jgi:hypothetical protein
MEAASPDGKSFSMPGTRPGEVTPSVVSFDLVKPENTLEAAQKMLVNEGRLRRGTIGAIIGSVVVGRQIVEAVQLRVV